MKMITNLMRVMIIMILSASVVFAQMQNKKDLPVQKVNYSTSDITTQNAMVQSAAIDNIAEKSAVQSTFQQVNGKNTLPAANSAKQIKVIPGSGSTDAVLYSQMTAATWGRASQDFETAYDIYDNQAGDDFTVTGGPWNINLVKFIGHYSTTGPAAGFNIYFYNDNAGLPGTLITSYPSVGYSVLGNEFSCTLPSTLVLADGTYWISIQVRMDFSPYGQWYWRANALPLIGYEGAWQNPGNGFGTGYTTWTGGGTVWGGTYPERDFCFELSDDIPLPSLTPSPNCQTVDGLFDAGGNVTYEMYLYAAETYNFSVCFEDLCCGGNFVGSGDGDFTMYDAALTELWYIDGNSSCNYAASTWNSAYENWAPPADGYYYLQVDDYYGTYSATYTLAYSSGGAVPLTVNETCTTEVGSFVAGSGVYYQISMLTTSTYNFSICALDATCPGDYVTGGAGDGDLYLLDNTGALVFYIDGTSACGWNASTWGTAYESYVPSYDGCYYLLVTDYAGASGTYTLGHIRVGCNVPCPPGSLLEGEAQIPDEGADVTNGGCNMLPSTPLFTPIASGDTYCGQTNTYTTTGGTVFRRDTDWYRFDASSSPASYWNFNISATAEFSLQILLINAGSETCTDYSIVGVATAGLCEVATLNGDYPSGIYYIWVGPQTASGNPYPFGGGPYEYTMSYTGTQLGVPVATINPPAVEILLAPETTTTTNLTIGNTGTYTLDYTAATSGTTALVYGDNFDAYAAGVQLATQNPTNWTTWSSAPGSTEDPYVSTDVAYNGANSVLITGVNDCVYPIPNYTTGNYKISFRMNVPAGFDGYFNVLQLFAGASSEWGTQVYFDAGGVASIDAGASAAASWAFAYDTWLLNELYVDLDNDYAEFYFDGTFIIGWQWSTGTFGTGTLNQLGGCNFYAYTGTQTPKYYFDDFKLEQVVNDWLTLDGGTATAGSILVGGANVDIVLGFSSIGKTPGATYTKVINFTTNELGAKTSYTIPVTMYVGYNLTGNVYYGVTGTTKPMATNTTVTITPGPTASTGPLGAYELRPLADGTYALTGATTKPWGGLNSFDATLVARYLGSIVTLTNLQKRSADVNLSNSITSFDGTLIKRRLGSIATPQWTAPNFVFDGPFPSTPLLIGMPITIAGANATQEFRTICSGDLNSSYTPPAE